MKKLIVFAMFGFGMISISSAGLQVLSKSGGAGSPVSVTVTSSEVVEFYGVLQSGDAPYCPILTVSVDSGTFPIAAPLINGQIWPGPLTFSLSGGVSAVYRTSISYRIVPATSYAKNGFDAGKSERMIANLGNSKRTSFISISSVLTEMIGAEKSPKS